MGIAEDLPSLAELVSVASGASARPFGHFFLALAIFRVDVLVIFFTIL
jgi:hypothetical protein